MKIKENISTLELSGIKKSAINYATIAPNAVIMSILGDKLYKNKIQSTVREVLSNAIDASIEAGVKTPVEIHCPTILEPWFSVKDYGIGMTADTIVDIYANYGESTKRKSNKLIGGFGIGAKVAMVYSGQFSVTSIKDGVKSVYQFFKDEKGMPANTPLFEGPTTEGNGTEVKIAANNTADFNEFYNNVKYYCEWLEYPVKCNKTLDLQKITYEHKDTNFGISNFPILNNNNALIIIGGIPYNFDYNNIGMNLYNYTYSSSSVGGICAKHLVFFGKIGEVDLIASREELEYTEKTKAFIKSVINEIKIWYTKYLASKTEFWLYQNRKPWESDQRYSMDYGFKIRYKSGSKWIIHDRAKAFKKYIAIDSIDDGRAWLTALRKIDETPETGAFILEKDKAALIKLGCPATDIVDFKSLPKLRRPKPKAYTQLVYDKNKLKRIKTDNVTNPITIRSSVYQNNYQIKNILIKLIRDDKQDVVVDENKPCGLAAFMEKKYGKKDTISYCSIVDTLERFGYVKKLTSHKDDGFNSIRKLFGLVNGDSVELEDEFPLLVGKTYTSWNTPDRKLKDHMIKYIDLVLKEDKTVLKNKHLKVLKKV